MKIYILPALLVLSACVPAAPYAPIIDRPGPHYERDIAACRVINDNAQRAAADKQAKENRNTHYIVMRGNHDVSRDLSRSSSFEIFTRLVASVPNITVVGDNPLCADGAEFCVADHGRCRAADHRDRVGDGGGHDAALRHLPFDERP